MLLATMRLPVPPDFALWAFLEEQCRFAGLDAGVDDGVGMACECGAQLARSVRDPG
jgi:hypothetical protein